MICQTILRIKLAYVAFNVSAHLGWWDFGLLLTVMVKFRLDLHMIYEIRLGLLARLNLIQSEVGFACVEHLWRQIRLLDWWSQLHGFAEHKFMAHILRDEVITVCEVGDNI